MSLLEMNFNKRKKFGAGQETRKDVAALIKVPSSEIKESFLSGHQSSNIYLGRKSPVMKKVA